MRGKEKGLSFNIQNKALILGNILLFLFIIILIDNKKSIIINRVTSEQILFIRFFIMILTIISVIVLFTQFLTFKKENTYIATLFYFNFSLEMIARFFVTAINIETYYNFRFFSTMICRGVFLVILLISLFKKDKIKSSKRKTFTVIYFIMTFIAIGLDLSEIIKNSEYWVISYQLTFIIDLLSVVITFLVMYKTKNLLYFLISITMMLSIVSNMYELHFMVFETDDFIKINLIFQLIISIISFIVLFIWVIAKSYEIFTRDKIIETDTFRKINFIEDNIKELILIINENFTIEYVSNSFKRLLGYEDEFLLGTDFWEIVSDKNERKIEKYLAKDFNAGDIIKLDILNKHNISVNFEARIHHFRDYNGNKSGFAMFITPLIEKNELEELKGQLNARKEYEEVQKEFYAELSHELRTPVNIMYSSIQLLELKKMEGDNDEFFKYYNKYGKIMMQNSLIMLKLINNLIDTTKIDSGFVKGEFNNYDIVSIIENITMISIPYLEAKNISLVFDTELEENFIRCDPDKIERIMLNLLSNAAKYTEENGEIYVDLFFDDDFVTIVVKDSGVGIPDNMKEDIFKKFEQVQDRKEKKLGSGIGLALVKSLVEIHNGFIEVKSKLGEGSEFIIKIPNKVEYGKSKEIEICSYDSQSKGDLSIEFSDLR